jgi:predicted branched-subunit amino acid permease
MRFFRKKAYGLTPLFVKSRVIIYHAKMQKKMLKKKRKKKRFSFFETFFLK